ncbi:hypothetical protein FA15DRAFT_607219 [Coprinopsis marcescibilis]|uniref:DUF4218 domain-containing protein n=1 Tax=Coprinopsis marcescibilis TaxID=230819 RepID=A0A5C3K8W7_COPMA|nr:hypothetical protein FA15DRAFT_607219 [Coprinopsis marcescibilis]
MFLVRVIPGPREPPVDAINHYFSSLVDELLEFWVHGVYFSRTHRHPRGRRIRCVLAAVVCDLPGARKTAGFAALSHTRFCSICECKTSIKNNIQQYKGYVDTPYPLWVRRTAESCRVAGQAYEDASDEVARRSVFDKTGVRCSEFHRLPYYDPARFVVVDAMHNLFLGLTQVHCTTLLGICSREQKLSPELVLHIPFSNDWQLFPENIQKGVKYLRTALESPLGPQLEDGQQHNEQEPVRIENPIAEELAELRADIHAMITPSWMSKLPSNLGDPSHGKLKADQWRLLATVYLPASLTRLWGKLDDNRKLLDVSMSLFLAISIATTHTTSQSRAQQYLQHYQAYIDGVKKLDKDYVFRPNHHMAFHLAEYLEMYGPVHSWWTFPFERMIGMLQHIPTNNIISEYPN